MNINQEQIAFALAGVTEALDVATDGDESELIANLCVAARILGKMNLDVVTRQPSEDG